MVNCELCGREAELVNARVEGVLVSICPFCAKFGQIVQEKKVSVKITREDVIEDVVENYAQLIRNRREEQGLTQKEFGQKLSEKESFISKLEQGTLPLSIEQAKKIEKILNLNLLTKIINIPLNKSNQTESFTLGDLIKKKI